MINRTTPSFQADFITGSLDPRISVARPLGTATRVNQSGFIEAVGAGIPRFNHDPVTKRCMGLLVEEQRTNSLTYSDGVNLAGWAVINASTSSAAVVSPSGAASVSSLSDNATNDRHIVYKIFASAGATYCSSVYFAKGTLRYVQLTLAGPATVYSVVADLQDGVITDIFSLSAVSPFYGIENAGNGFWRVHCGHTITAGTSYFIVATSNSATPVFDVNGNIAYSGSGQTLYAYGAQNEIGGFPTSYIPTVASALTRNADIATITGANFDSFWRSGTGSALVRARPSRVSGVAPVLQFDDATTNNIIALRGNTTNPELYIKATTDQAQIDAGTIAANTSYRLAGAWAADNCAASLNSGTAVTDAAATIPAATQARLGSDGTNYLNGHIEAVEYYDERAVNASLQVVSSTAGYRSIIGSVFRDAIIS